MESIRSGMRTAGRMAVGIAIAFAGFACSGTTGADGARSDGSETAAPMALDAPVVDELRAGMEKGSSTFDHGTYDELLGEHVDIEQGAVDYEGLRQDRGKLEQYLERVASADLEALPRDEQLALLINAYNASTLHLIVDNYPGIDSIKDLEDPWTTANYEVGGHELSLDQIEHGLIRPLYRDPRIHFAVNCAAVDCPYLADEAYRGERIDEQLERRTRAVLSNEQFARVENETLRYSRVMKWYRFDFVDSSFEKSAMNVPKFIARYAGEDVRSFVERHDGTPPAKPLEYDWSLNRAD